MIMVASNYCACVTSALPSDKFLLSFVSKIERKHKGFSAMILSASFVYDVYYSFYSFAKVDVLSEAWYSQFREFSPYL